DGAVGGRRPQKGGHVRGRESPEGGPACPDALGAASDRRFGRTGGHLAGGRWHRRRGQYVCPAHRQETLSAPPPTRFTGAATRSLWEDETLFSTRCAVLR